MLSSLLLAATFQVGPFYQQKPAEDYWAVRPFYAREGEVTDVLWPLFTKHRDWWSVCYLATEQDYSDGVGYQFSLAPIWFNGRDAAKGAYAGLFPLAGYHPHVGMMYDVKFGLWPLWHQYKMPRTVYGGAHGVSALPSLRTQEWMTTNAILFPFISWRSDGAWSFWPLYGVNYQRESDHRYVLWPLATWASYRADRDTAGEGCSWMLWPLYGQVRRQYERQDLFLPPFFSWTRTWSKCVGVREGASDTGDSWRLRCPWPLVDLEFTPSRRRVSVFPFYENVVDLDYAKGEESAHVTRYLWKLVEIYDDETRVFPFYASGRDHFRIWPFFESETESGGKSASVPSDTVTHRRVLSLVPIRWLPQIDRNWAKFWTFYENDRYADHTEHSLLWGIIRWRTEHE